MDYAYSEETKKTVENAVVRVIFQISGRAAEETKTAFHQSGATGRYLAVKTSGPPG